MLLGILVLVAGIYALLRGRDYLLGSWLIVFGIAFLLLAVAWSIVLGAPADRLDVKVVNETRDPIHVVVMFNGTVVINTNLAPPQWFGEDNDVKIRLFEKTYGPDDGVISVSINNATAQSLPGLWGPGDSVSITINADGTITYKMRSAP